MELEVGDWRLEAELSPMVSWTFEVWAGQSLARGQRDQCRPCLASPAWEFDC